MREKEFKNRNKSSRLNTGVFGGDMMIVEKATQTRLSSFFSTLADQLIFCFDST